MPGKTLAAVVVAVIAIFVVAEMAYQSLTARATAMRSVNHTNEVRLQLNLLLSDLTDAETGQRGFMLTGLEPYLEPHNRARTSLPVELVHPD